MALRLLTSRYPGDEPWCLVVSDITRPAFLQPPATCSDRKSDYKRSVITPDELDMLRTAKNHDLKSAVAHNGKVDDWLFALVTVQTMDGYTGSGNHGISRMNGGNGNRPAFSLAPSGGVGAHVGRDMVALLNHRKELMRTFEQSDNGHALLWTVPWDGTKEEALSIEDLDPFYIEICRRIRLSRETGDLNIQGVRATSKGPRVEARHLKGRTGDPWTPFNVKESKSLTLSAPGFTYRRIAEYLTSGDYKWPLLLEPTSVELSDGRDMQLLARATVRGQGKTEGYYERIIPLRQQTKRALGTASGRETIADISRKRIQQVQIAQRILSHAIQTFMARGHIGNTGHGNRRLARHWLDRLDNTVDNSFFQELQVEFEASNVDRPGVRRSWLLRVVQDARDLLADATDTLPCPAAYRYRARSVAVGLFEGRIRGADGLPSLFGEDKS